MAGISGEQARNAQKDALMAFASGEARNAIVRRFVEERGISRAAVYGWLAKAKDRADAADGSRPKNPSGDDRIVTLEAVVKKQAEIISRVDQSLFYLVGKASNSRVEFSAQTKRDLIRATIGLGSRCPCCGQNRVIEDNGEKSHDAEFDHFFANHRAAIDSGWLICRKCHIDITRDAALRAKVSPHFVTFQNQRINLGHAQLTMWEWKPPFEPRGSNIMDLIHASEAH